MLYLKMPDNQITLYNLNLLIQNTLNSSFHEPLWVVAEISQMNVNSRNGHCYMELIEKNTKTNKILAKSRATVWSFAYSVISSHFKQATGQPMTNGIKVLVRAKVEFHELYGLSLNITDIDPNYTLGDIARQRQETIAKLKAEGVFDINRETEFETLPQRLAVISSPTAAGYDDFINQLLNNEYGYWFNIELFEAVMQGEKTEQSVVNALNRIAEREQDFDAVVIIRGGGSKFDLAWFDSYEIASNVAQFPLPVITGIGHERDETITDLVANTWLKTPTAAATFLIDRLLDFENYLNDLFTHTSQVIQGIVDIENLRIQKLSQKINQLTNKKITANNNGLQKLKMLLMQNTNKYLAKKTKEIQALQTNIKLQTRGTLSSKQSLFDTYKYKLNTVSQRLLLKQNSRLKLYENTIKHTDPQRILNKGYSYTMINGKIIKNIEDVKKGDTIETQLMSGIIESKIVSLAQNK